MIQWLARLLISGGVMVLLAGMIWRMFFFIASDEAFINTEILGVLTPIKGRLQLAAKEPGNLMKKGQKLFEVGDERYGDAVVQSRVMDLLDGINQAENNLTAEELAVAKWKITCEQLSGVDELGGVSGNEYQKARLELRAAEALARQRQCQLREWRNKYAEFEKQVRLYKQAAECMPFDGVVWSIKHRSGELVKANDEVLQVVNPENIYVEALFGENSAKKIRVGGPPTSG